MSKLYILLHFITTPGSPKNRSPPSVRTNVFKRRHRPGEEVVCIITRNKLCVKTSAKKKAPAKADVFSHQIQTNKARKKNSSQPDASVRPSKERRTILSPILHPFYQRLYHVRTTLSSLFFKTKEKSRRACWQLSSSSDDKHDGQPCNGHFPRIKSRVYRERMRTLQQLL